jgi:hypothetical protein
MAQEQMLRIYTHVKDQSYPLQQQQQQFDSKNTDLGSIKEQNTSTKNLSDEDVLLSKSKQVFQNYEEATSKLKKANDYLRDNASNTMNIDLQHIMDYRESKSKVLKLLQIEASDLYATINKFLIGKKAILKFFSDDLKEFGETRIKKIKQDIIDFEEILKKLSLVTTSA